MISEEVQDSGSSSGTSRTPRPFSGTQLRPSYSAVELGTPSGEVIFNFRRQDHGRAHEDQANLTLGGESPRLPFTGDHSEPGKTTRSDRMGVLTEMLASVGNLRGDIMKEMATLTQGSGRETTRSTEVQGPAGQDPGTGEITMGSPSRTRVVGHARSGSWDLLSRRGMASVEDAVSKAQGTGVRTDNNGVSVQTRGNPDRRVHEGDIRQTYGRVGVGNQPLYRGSRAIPEGESSLPIRAHQKKPANFDGTSSFQDYLVQFNMVGDLNRWDEEMKAMELATSLRGAAQTVLSDLRPEQRRDYHQLVCALTARFEPTNQTELYRAQIKSRLRRKSESVQELANDIKRLVRRAYPQATNDLRDQIARDSFIDSLNEHELEWFVYQGKPKTVDEAMQLALEFEAFQAGRKRSANVRQCTKDDSSTESSDPSKILNRFESLEKKIEAVLKQSNNIICHNCRNRGHKAKDCTQKQAQANHPFNRYHNYQNRGPTNTHYRNNQSNTRQGNFQ